MPDQDPPDPALSDQGLPDLNALLGQAMEMQQQLLAAQAQAAEVVVEGQAGGGAVVIEVTGAMDFRVVHIEPAAVDPDDVELLQDLVLAALHDAMAKVAALQEQSMGVLGAGGLGDLLGGVPEPDVGTGALLDIAAAAEWEDDHDDDFDDGPGDDGDDEPEAAGDGL